MMVKVELERWHVNNPVRFMPIVRIVAESVAPKVLDAIEVMPDHLKQLPASRFIRGMTPGTRVLDHGSLEVSNLLHVVLAHRDRSDVSAVYSPQWRIGLEPVTVRILHVRAGDEPLPLHLRADISARFPKRNVH
jgi:hypothetical protein